MLLYTITYYMYFRLEICNLMASKAAKSYVLFALLLSIIFEYTGYRKINILITDLQVTIQEVKLLGWEAVLRKYMLL